MEKLVSIILPTYNGEQYLAISIESCLVQSYKNIELIIVDDCSTDQTPEIIKKYQETDYRIKYIRNQKNLKLPLSLNVGFQHASGEFFTWTSDDNFYAHNAIETMMNALENKAEKLVYCNYTIIDEVGSNKGTHDFGDVNKSMVTWKGCGACFLYHRSVHESLKGYDPSAFLIEDYDFFLRALTITKFIYIPGFNLYFYRHHPKSLTSIYGYYNFDLQKIVIERQLPKLLEICSTKDKIRWIRKFAVYYGASKNNINRMNDYLGKLFIMSKTETFITIFYIIYKKISSMFSVGLSALFALFRLYMRNYKPKRPN